MGYLGGPFRSFPPASVRPVKHDSLPPSLFKRFLYSFLGVALRLTAFPIPAAGFTLVYLFRLAKNLPGHSLPAIRHGKAVDKARWSGVSTSTTTMLTME